VLVSVPFLVMLVLFLESVPFLVPLTVSVSFLVSFLVSFFGVGVDVHIDFGIVGIVAVIVVVVVIGDGIGIGTVDKITAHINQKRESTKQSDVSFSDNSSLIESLYNF
jgi:ABC-type multidrug transport system permease subunit